MRRLLIALPALPGLVWPALAAPVPKDLADPPVYYFPTTVGTEWVYEEEGREWTEVVTAVEARGDARVVTVKRVVKEGREAPSLKALVSARGVWRVESMGHKDDPPIFWLKLPVEAGAEWEYTWPGGKTDRMRVFAPELVEAPAGKYRAVPVELSWRLDGRAGDAPGLGGIQFRATRWFAPGVGVVRQRGSNYKLVLKSFTPGR